MKKMGFAAWQGIQIALVIFFLLCVVFGVISGENAFPSGYDMVKMCLATLLIGLGFGIPSLVYDTKLNMGLKVLIHMGTGILVMVGASVFAGWLSAERGLIGGLLLVALQILAAFLIWKLYPPEESPKKS